jgi:hypothetical protein
VWASLVASLLVVFVSQVRTRRERSARAAAARLRLRVLPPRARAQGTQLTAKAAHIARAAARVCG